MNKRKYTLRNRRLSIISVLIPCCLLFGCAKDITPSLIIQTPPKTESAIPHFKKVENGIDRSIQSNTKIDSKIKEQKGALLDQKIVIEETITKIERLVEQVTAHKTIQEIDAIDILNSIKTIHTRNLFLETQNNELTQILSEQEGILKMTKEDASITYRKLIDKEEEVNRLRELNKLIANNLVAKDNDIRTLQNSLQKEKINSARANVYRNWVYGLAGSFIAWLIIKNILMVYFPLARFRI